MLTVVKRRSEIRSESRPQSAILPEPTRLARPVLGMCFLVILLGSLDLGGWLFHIPILTSLLPHYSTMKPNTAATLVLLAVGLVMRSRNDGPPVRWKTIAANTVAAVVLCMGAGTLLEYLTGANFGLDNALFRLPLDKFGDPAGRMALGTALSVSLVGLATLLIERAARLSAVCYLIVAGLSLSALVGFIFNAGPLFAVRWLSSLAVHTAFCLCLLSVAGILLRPEREPLHSLVQQSYREGRSRWLLIGVTLLPLAVSAPAVVLMRVGAIDAGFALSMVVVVLSAVLTGILWRDSVALGQAEHRRRRIEAALVKSEKLAVVGRLAASISHEIKNPLEAVNTLMYLIREAESMEEARSFALTAEGELARINHITTQTLGFFRESRDKTGCDPTAVIESALELLNSKIVASGVEIVKDFKVRDEEVNSNAGELRQVVINLISNAVEATGANGRLTIRVHLARSCFGRSGVNGVRILFADSGTGMESDVRKQVFEPFFTTKLDTGNGLGLWVAKDLIEKTGGTIRVWSSTIPKASGTVFSIFLPSRDQATRSKGPQRPC